MAAALLAADHFNSRNAAVVPELKRLAGECTVTLSLDAFFDTGSLTLMSGRRFYEFGEEPCAVVGPFNDYPASELGVFAASAQFPLVLTRAFSTLNADVFFRRFTSTLFPNFAYSASEIIEFLGYKGRTDYVALLYSLSNLNVQRHEAFTSEADKNRMENVAVPYWSPFVDNPDDGLVEDRKLLTSLRKIKEVGYRTIVIALDNIWELPYVADTAEALNMNNGDYFYVFWDVFDFSFTTRFPDNKNITKLVKGAAFILPMGPEAAEVTRQDVAVQQPFQTAWKEQGAAQVERLNQMNPIQPDGVGYRFAGESFFQTVRPEYGSGKSFFSLFVPVMNHPSFLLSLY
jgi:hypothetical protein